MSTRTALACAALLLLSTAACKSKVDPNVAVRSDSSGIEIISNTGKYLPIKWQFDTAFVIGSSHADSAFMRVRAHTVQVSPDGHVYVLDTGTRAVRIYDSAGKLQKLLTPSGDAKLSIPASIVLQPDGFAVYDADVLALVRFSPDGNYLGRVPAPRQYRGGMLSADSGALVLAQRIQDSKTNTPVLSILRVSSTDTTSIIAAALDEETTSSMPTCGGVTLILAPIFGEPPAWTASHGVTAVAEAPLYGVRLYRKGQEFRRIRRKLKPEESSNQYATLAAEPGQVVRRPDGTTCTVPATDIALASGWKEVIPAIKAIAITPQGGMWVQRVDPGHSHPAVDIIDAKGQYIGTLPLNTPWPIGFLPDGNPVALTEDSIGNTFIVGYRVNTNPPPAAKKVADGSKRP